MPILTGRIYPNGEFGIGIIKRFKMEKFEKYDKDREKTWEENCLDVHGLRECLRYRREASPAESGLPLVQDASRPSSPLDLTLDSNSHSLRRGLKGISSYGRKLTRIGADLLQWKHGKKHLSFLTLTIPSIGEEAWRSVCGSWSEILRIFVQWLSRRLKAAGLDGQIVGATEVQGRRFRRTGEPGLHFHCVFQGRRRGGSWAVSPLQLREAWRRAVSTKAEKIPQDASWERCENVVRVKSSASGYLGKYMSKGSREVGAIRELHGDAFVPRTWNTCTSRLRESVKKSSETLSDEQARQIIKIAECLSGRGAHISYVCVGSDGGDVIVGWFGRLPREALSALGLGKRGKAKALAHLSSG